MTGEAFPAAPAIGLMRAAGEKNLEALRQHIAHGSDINLLSGTLDRTPLMEAALQDWKEGIETLIAAGAKVNAKNKAGVTAVVMAVGKYKKESLAALAAAGADLAVVDETGESLLGRTCRRWCAQDITRQLIALGAPLDIRGADGKTPLMRSMDEPDSNQVASQYLIDAGADIEARDAAGNTPLIRAAEKYDANTTVRLLEKGADIDAVNDEGLTARDYALIKAGAPGLPGLYADQIIEALDKTIASRAKAVEEAAAAGRARMEAKRSSLRSRAAKIRFTP